MKHRLRALATSAVLASACGASAPRVEAPIQRASTSHGSSASPAPRGTARSAAITATLVPSLTAVQSAGHADEPYFVVGSMRVVASAHPHAATDRPVSSIARVIHAPRGWVFFAQDGGIFGSDAFDGSLRRLGEISRSTSARALSATRPMREDGTAAFVDGQGALWLTDGTDAIHRVDELASGVIDVAFADADHGTAATERGLMFTSDAGAHWRRLETSGAAWSVESRRGVIVAHTTAGTVTIANDATITEGESRPVYPNITPRKRDSVLSVVSLAVPAIRWTHAAPLGETLVSITDHDVVVTDLATDREVHRTSVSLPSGCSLQTWGASVVAECEFHHQVHRSRDGRVFELLPWFTDNEMHAFSDDGVHAAAPHACVGAGSAANSRAVCAFDANTSASTNIAMPGEATRVLSIRGGMALVAYAIDASSTSIARVDLEHGTVAPVQIELNGPSNVLFAQFVSDRDVIVGVRRTGTDATLLATGDLGSALHPQPLSVAATDAAILPSGDWLLTGDDAAHVWIARDHGARVEPITFDVDGNAANVSLRGDTLACTTRACTIGPLVIDWTSTSPRERSTVFTAMHAPPARDTHADHPLTGWVCAMDNTRVPPPATPGGVPANATHTALNFPGGRAILHIWQIGGRTHGLLTWRAIDQHGVLRQGSTRDQIWSDASAPADIATLGTSRVRAVTSGGLLLEQCPGHTQPACDVLWAPRAGRVIALDVAGRRAHTPSAMRLGWALEHEDGGVTFSLAQPVPDTYAEEIVEISAAGAIVRRGSFVASGAATRPQAVVRHAGEYGIAIRARDDHTHWTFHPMSRPADVLDLTLAADAPLRACTRPTPHDADLWLGVLPNFADYTRFEDVENVWLNRVLVEVTPSGRCVRAVETGSALANPLIEVPADARPTRIASQHNGSFTGLLDDPDAQHRVRCVAPMH